MKNHTAKESIDHLIKGLIHRASPDANWSPLLGVMRTAEAQFGCAVELIC
jgi:hypothetical protein